VTDYAIFHR